MTILQLSTPAVASLRSDIFDRFRGTLDYFEIELQSIIVNEIATEMIDLNADINVAFDRVIRRHRYEMSDRPWWAV